MVREFFCPDHITDLFDDDETLPEGRRQAIAWAKGLDLREGDRVWMPNEGWTKKKTAVQ